MSSNVIAGTIGLLIILVPIGWLILDDLRKQGDRPARPLRLRRPGRKRVSLTPGVPASTDSEREVVSVP
jgi:hypothetical protein